MNIIIAIILLGIGTIGGYVLYPLIVANTDKVLKGYYDGLKQGYRNAQKEVAHLFKNHLIFAQKNPCIDKMGARAEEKFKDFLTIDNDTAEQ